MNERMIQPDNPKENTITFQEIRELMEKLPETTIIRVNLVEEAGEENGK